MSIRVMTVVFDHAPYKEGVLLVLLAMADWADDDGGRIFPTVARLALKARLSDRATQRCLKKLRDDGVINLVTEAKGRPGLANEWRIDVERVKQMHPSDLKVVEDETDDANDEQGAGDVSNVTPIAGENDGCQKDTRVVGDADGCRLEHGRVTLATQTGDVGDIPPCTPHIDSTVIEPPSQPSSQPPLAGARATDEMPSFLRRVWPAGFEAFMAAGPWHVSSSKIETETEWKVCHELPPPEHLVASAKAYFAAIAKENTRRRKDDPTPPVSSQRFIRDRKWLDHQPRIVADRSLAPAAWDGHPVAKKLRAELGDGVFDAWLGMCRLEIKGQIVTLHAPRKLVRDYVALHYMARVEREFEGNFVLLQLAESAA